MHKFTFLPSIAFPANALRTLMSINTIDTIRTSFTLLKSPTQLLLTIISQRFQLRSRQDMVMGVLAIDFGTSERVEIEHVTCSGRKMFNRKPDVSLAMIIR